MIFSKLFFGGGTLDHRADQNEINFLLYPELMAGMLFLQSLYGNESIEVRGCDRYNDYQGSNYHLTFNGDFKSSFKR